MKITVDADKCQGHNRCSSLAPDLFDIDEFGYATARDGGDVPEGQEANAELAIANCPEYAITVVQEGT
jgi:ferredoxin